MWPKLSIPKIRSSKPSHEGSVWQHALIRWEWHIPALSVCDRQSSSSEAPPACHSLPHNHIPGNSQWADHQEEKKAQIWFADGSASLAVICWHLTPRAFQPHLGSKDDGGKETFPGSTAWSGLQCPLYLKGEMAWEEDAHHVRAVTTSLKGWATWSMGRGMWMDISGWTPIWENHWVSITGMVKNSHCARDSSVCEQQIAWPVPSMFFTQQPHGQSGHGFRHRDGALAQQGLLTKADCLLPLLMNFSAAVTNLRLRYNTTWRRGIRVETLPW